MDKKVKQRCQLLAALLVLDLQLRIIFQTKKNTNNEANKKQTYQYDREVRMLNKEDFE